MKKTIDTQLSTVQFTFSNGKTLTMDAAKLSDEIRHRCELHGLSQKVGDAAAGKDEQDGYEACYEQWGRLLDGEWSKKRESGDSLLVRAIIELSPEKDANRIRAHVLSLSAPNKRKLARNSKVAAKIAELSATSESDEALDELLDEI